jgi:4-amino-4-deoxy-L-arabinose transferase-like glycosyltransferase
MAFGQSTGRLAGLLLALLPSWVLYGDLEYDLLLGTLYMLLIYLFFVRPPQGHKLWYIALMGLLLGYTALVKPVVVLFPLAALVGYLALKVRPGEAVKRTAVMGLCMLAAISPWTIRNYLVLDHFILISTNFGVVLHTANNPEADGREMMMKPIPGEDEVQMNQRHIREAADWIVHNPLPFLKLCAYRVAWTWGSDSGFLNSNTILCGKVSPFTMNAARGVVQGAYLSVMIVWAIGLFAHRKRILGSILALAFLAPILYVWGMHVVMQAHSQHHLPTIPFVIILASATLILRAGLLPANGEPDTPLMGEH